ncbi:MAG TPA: DEAD/DEAH box helicase family protein [Pirellulaceae bacterium]|nr:DEAD/DEAH box helicase family protein [Pirellulaceae bacterium]
MSHPSVNVHRQSPPAAKIALFRSLFRGRDDVYPRRFESRTSGKTGYAPACRNEWVAGICEKPRVKCATCQHRKFLPVSDEMIWWHLSGHDDQGGDFVAGVYPMLLDETCFLLAIDFDKSQWQDDARAVVETCRRIGVPVALERSRSGHGGHVWMFFEEAISATLARRLAAHILTETMERRPDIGLDSYDRFFPNQDTLPRGGFGNLIALPLQKRPRDVGNSVFIDEHLSPYPDQWSFLSSLERIARNTVEDVVRDASHGGRILGVRMASQEEDDTQPWTALPSRRPKERTIADPLPERLELTLCDQIYIAKQSLPPPLRNRLLRLAAFQNPEFYKSQAMRLPTYGKPRIISCAEDHAQHIGLPRGCLEDVHALLSDLRIKVDVRDERVVGQPLDVTFQGDLRPGQKTAAREMLAHDTGVLSATTAFGKTVVAGWLIAERGVNTLILVHRRQLLDQWVERLATFLALPKKEIGRIGGGRKKATGKLDVAIIQSLVRKGVVDDRVGEYGHLIVDECHHLSAQSFELVARRAKAKYVTGLSATVSRKDGHHPIIFMQCGPVRHRVDAKAEAVARPFAHTVHVRPTSFQPVFPADPDMRVQFQDLYRELISDDDRNRMICDEVVQSVQELRSPLVLTERKEHLESLATRLESRVRHVIVLHGGTGRKETREVADRLAGIPAGEDRVLLATGRYIGEGFDDSRLDTLFLTLPVSWRGTVAQYVGRLHRLHEGKTEVRVYDYADLNVPMLARMFDRRCAGYEAVGYSVLLPGSAVPGWPIEVPLPVDPQWKHEYAASVRRLVRDGVDAPLAKLFTHVTREVDPNAEGIKRARSATEAFLYRRLETLPETSGRFRLNAELPIPFDGRGNMEVDLLCSATRLAIELDGGQHLGSEEAYRRDRRKDALLQEHGYFVLRFLTQDVGRELDTVLDVVLRASASRRVTSAHIT